METLGIQNYVPVVLTRRGERTALSSLDPAVAAHLVPLFVVHPIEWDYDVEDWKTDVASHVRAIPDQLSKAWGSREAFIDLAFLGDDAMEGDQHPLVWLTAEAKKLGLPLIPVTSPSRSALAIAAARDVHKRDGRGVCVRLSLDEWPSSAPSALEQFVRKLGLAPQEVDLVLDVAADGGSLALAALTAELRALPLGAAWRNVIVASASMPESMPTPKGVNRAQRTDWQMYLGLRGLASPLPRMPIYADYVIAHPNPVSTINPRFMNIVATMRYTAEKELLLVRGGGYRMNGGRGEGAPAMIAACEALRLDPGYMGRGHCPTDQWVEDVALGAVGGSSPETWRMHGTRHHLVAVTEQLATLTGP